MPTEVVMPEMGDSIAEGTIIESLHLTRSEERELRQIIGLEPPEPRSRFERLRYGPFTGGEATLIIISLVVLAYAARGLFSPLNPWGEILMNVLMPTLMIGFLLGHQQCKRLVFKVYRALEEERQLRRRAEEGGTRGTRCCS